MSEKIEVNQAMELKGTAIDEQMRLKYEEETTIDKLTRETNRLEKDIKHIKESRRYQISKLLRVFSYVKMYFLVLFRGKAIHRENMKLKEELIKRDYMIQQQREQLDFVDRAIDGLKRQEPHSEKELVKLLRMEGQAFEFIDKLLKDEQNRQQQTKLLVDQLTRSHRHLESEELKNFLYEKTALLYRQAQFPEYLIRQFDQRNLSFTQLDSFSNQLARRFRLRQLADLFPDTILDDKKTAYQFIEQLQIPYPKHTDQVYTIDSLPKKSAIVIKPANGDGGRGVYLVKSETNIIDIKRERKLSSWTKLTEAMREDLKRGWVTEDQWFTEELLSLNADQPARDLKFYCFYGIVGLVLEVDRTSKTQYCWWDDKGRRIHTGKYENEQFEGLGVSQEEIDQVNSLSLHIPAPFMRIDFLRTEKGLYFGEFTPKPGNFDQFDLETDMKLGQLYLEAETRLLSDLLNGKEFVFFNNLIKDSRRNA